MSDALVKTGSVTVPSHQASINNAVQKHLNCVSIDFPSLLQGADDATLLRRSERKRNPSNVQTDSTLVRLTRARRKRAVIYANINSC